MLKLNSFPLILGKKGTNGKRKIRTVFIHRWPFGLCESPMGSKIFTTNKI